MNTINKLNANKPSSETTEQQAARLVSIPIADLHASQLTEIGMVADMMTHRSQHWKMVAAQLLQQSGETDEAASRMEKIADALHKAADHLAAVKGNYR